MFRAYALQIDEAQMLNRNALHALMGLEATPIKAGGFKYIHRDTGMVFEIAPATPDSAGWTHLPHVLGVMYRSCDITASVKQEKA